MVITIVFTLHFFNENTSRRAHQKHSTFDFWTHTRTEIMGISCTPISSTFVKKLLLIDNEKRDRFCFFLFFCYTIHFIFCLFFLTRGFNIECRFLILIFYLWTSIFQASIPFGTTVHHITFRIKINLKNCFFRRHICQYLSSACETAKKKKSIYIYMLNMLKILFMTFSQVIKLSFILT